MSAMFMLLLFNGVIKLYDLKTSEDFNTLDGLMKRV